MLATLQPKNSIEAFWAKDFVDLTLEIKCLRQIEAGLLEAQARDPNRSHDRIERDMAERWANLSLVEWAQKREIGPLLKDA